MVNCLCLGLMLWSEPRLRRMVNFLGVGVGLRAALRLRVMVGA